MHYYTCDRCGEPLHDDKRGARFLTWPGNTVDLCVVCRESFHA
jgi:hypothetical protein